jgi:diguanylate cyclase (GGDEF)-like protein
MEEKRSRRSNRFRTTRAEMFAMVAAATLIVMLSVGAWSAYYMVASLRDHANESAYLTGVVAHLDALLARAADAENEHRAYLQNADANRLKGFNEALAGIQSEFRELLKLTSDDQGAQLEIQAAKAQTDKTLESIRDAIDYQRIGQNAHALAVVGQSGSIAATVKEATASLQKKFETALFETRNRPREVASRTATWLLVTWLLAAIVGGGVAALAVRQARLVGRLHRRLRRESIYDELTSLPNAVYLEEWLTRSLARAAGTNMKVGVLYVDINDFKQVNHGLGYAEGDKVLLEVSEKLRQMTRSSDFLARVRNDSFAVVMPDVVDMQQVESEMSRLSGISVVRSGIAIKTTVGAAIFPEDAESADNLLRLSRAAMYRNRQTRRAA